MVKKVPKSKPIASVKKTTTAVKKAASAVQKALSKENKTEKLSNGYVKEKQEEEANVKTAENTEMESGKITDSTSERLTSDENIDSVPENMPVEEAEITEQKSSQDTEQDKTVPKARKRKAAVDVSEKVTITKTRSKKQKVRLEVPEISSVVGKVFVLGDNSLGQLGFNDDIIEKKRPALLDMPYSIVDIAAGALHSVCLTQTGEVITFGCNDEGALGRETEEDSQYIPRIVSIPERIVQISAGDSHTAALSESGQVYIWGNFRNNNGVMGLIRQDTKETSPVRILQNVTIVKITSGNDHLTCLSNDGTVFTCGNAEAGQLGRVSEHASADGGRKGMTHLLSPQKVSVSTSTRVFASDAWTGSFATFLKLNNGSIYAFGLNNYGQLGDNPDHRVIWKPKRITSFKEKSWKEINGGQHHTLALDTEGLVYSLGRSEYGRLGLGPDCEAVAKPTAVPSLQDKKCSSISCGNTESFALEDNGSVYSWGFGTNYQLGHGNDSDQYTPKLIEGNFYNSWKAIKVSGGGQHTLILAHQRNTSEETK